MTPEEEKELAEWKDKAENMSDFYLDSQAEIFLLRAVYDDSRAIMFCNEHLLSKPVRDSLSCAIGCVERFDEGEK